MFKNLKSGELQYEDGFKLGFSYTSHVVINNHLKIRIKYHAVPKSVVTTHLFQLLSQHVKLNHTDFSASHGIMHVPNNSPPTNDLVL